MLPYIAYMDPMGNSRSNPTWFINKTYITLPDEQDASPSRAPLHEAGIVSSDWSADEWAAFLAARWKSKFESFCDLH